MQKRSGTKEEIVEKSEFTKIINSDYEIYKPINEIKAVLILFGGYHEVAEDIRREFKVLEIAKDNNIAVIISNFNKKLWLEERDKNQLSKSIQNIFESNQLPIENVRIGGFSSGGNISLILSNYLISNQSIIQPKGVFVIDPPVDLLQLYRLSQRNLELNFSATSTQEANWLMGLFHEEFGLPENGIDKYEEYSPYNSETNNINNLLNLDGLELRFYSEPDTLWWKENRNNKSYDLNAYWIEKLTNVLNEKFTNSIVEYITTENKGFRANGERHPHSWSIVDKEELSNWILRK